MQYLEAVGKSTCEIVIKRSRFIGTALGVASEQEALDALYAVRKQYSDASHNCYAYCIGQNANPIRYSDDGEPGGTAGIPILEVVKKNNVTNLLVVVTRYFGGTLLGASGLVRAYTQAAAQCVAQIPRVRIETRAVCEIRISYPVWARLEETLKLAGALFEHIDYADTVQVCIHAAPQDMPGIVATVREASSGCAQICDLGATRVAVPV